MLLARTLLITSLIFNLCVIGFLIYAEQGGKSDFTHSGTVDLISAVLTILLISTIALLPWLNLYRSITAFNGELIAIVFSVLTIFSCTVIFLLMPSGPAEALGYNVLIQWLIVWISFFVLSFLGRLVNAK